MVEKNKSLTPLFSRRSITVEFMDGPNVDGSAPSYMKFSVKLAEVQEETKFPKRRLTMRHFDFFLRFPTTPKFPGSWNLGSAKSQAWIG